MAEMGVGQVAEPKIALHDLHEVEAQIPAKAVGDVVQGSEQLVA
jgi:hypothetical protein